MPMPKNPTQSLSATRVSAPTVCITALARCRASGHSSEGLRGRAGRRLRLRSPENRPAMVPLGEGKLLYADPLPLKSWGCNHSAPWCQICASSPPKGTWSDKWHCNPLASTSTKIQLRFNLTTCSSSAFKVNLDLILFTLCPSHV